MQTNNFYRSWKDDIDQVLIKAWNGQDKELSANDIKTFREIMRYK
jgi:hypothetical protein